MTVVLLTGMLVWTVMLSPDGKGLAEETLVMMPADEVTEGVHAGECTGGRLVPEGGRKTGLLVSMSATEVTEPCAMAVTAKARVASLRESMLAG